MTLQNTQDLLDAIATQLVLTREQFPQGIPVSDDPDGPHIDRVDYREGDPQVWLRLTNGEAWLLRVHQLNSIITRDESAGVSDVIRSYCHYKALHRQWLIVLKTAESAGLDTELIAQAYHDDTLGDDERADWDRWQSGGHASNAEWDLVNRLIDAGTLST